MGAGYNLGTQCPIRTNARRPNYADCSDEDPAL